MAASPWLLLHIPPRFSQKGASGAHRVQYILFKPIFVKTVWKWSPNNHQIRVKLFAAHCLRVEKEIEFEMTWLRSATDHDLVWNHASQHHCSLNHLSYYVIQKYYNFWEKFNQLFIRACQSFPHLDAQFNLAPQTYNQYTTLGLNFGYIFCVPNWVHILCTKLGTYLVHQIGYIFSIPNWV